MTGTLKFIQSKKSSITKQKEPPITILVGGNYDVFEKKTISACVSSF